jgi:hypothetical protein
MFLDFGYKKRKIRNTREKRGGLDEMKKAAYPIALALAHNWILPQGGTTPYQQTLYSRKNTLSDAVLIA